MDQLYLGIEIGGTKLQLVVGDQSATIRERCRLVVDPTQGGAGIRRQIKKAVPELLRAHDVRAIGVGFGGPVDWKQGQICCSHQIKGWADFRLGDWLHSLTKKSVAVDNDANVAALGEAQHGAGVGFNPVFFMTLGSGVGGGLVANGNIYHGAKPGEAEIGHVLLDRNGTILESRCSGWAVDKKIRQLKSTVPGSLLCKLAGKSKGSEAKHLGAALAKRDPAAKRILSETAENLAFGLSHVVHLFNPEIIILGGGLSLLGEPLRAAVEKATRRFVMKAFLPGPRIVLPKLGEDSVPMGALVLAFQQAAKYPSTQIPK
jgi:glucokinase